MNEFINMKKVLLIIIGVIAIGVVIWFIHWFLTTGTLKVATENEAEVNLIEIDEGTRVKDQIGTGDTTKRLKAGRYTVVADLAEKGSSQKTINIKPRETTKIDLSIQAVKKTEEVLPGASYSIVAGNNKLRFLDKNMDLIYELKKEGDKAEELFYDLYPVTDVKWINIRNALVQTQNNQFEIIKNDSVENFRYPQGLEPEVDFGPQVFSYDVNDRGQTIVNLENEIYLYQNLQSKPQKIHDLENENIILNFANNGLIFGHTDAFAFGHSEAEEHNFLLNSKGENQELSPEVKDSGITFAEWSPDSKKLLIEMGGEVYIYHVDSQKLEPFIQYPPQNIESTVWRGNDELIVVVDNGIWKASTKTRKLEKLTDLPDPVNHSDAFTIQGNTMYFSTSPSGDGSRSGTLYRLTF